VLRCSSICRISAAYWLVLIVTMTPSSQSEGNDAPKRIDGRLTPVVARLG
jgi:hypothetical protein